MTIGSASFSLSFDMMLRTRDSNILFTLTPVLALVSWYSIPMSSAKRCEEMGKGVWREGEERRVENEEGENSKKKRKVQERREEEREGVLHASMS